MSTGCAPKLLKEQEDQRETTTSGPAVGSGSDEKRVRDLEKTIDKLQVSSDFGG